MRNSKVTPDDIVDMFADMNDTAVSEAVDAAIAAFDATHTDLLATDGDSKDKT